jgi:hypothetical protein
MKSLSIKLGLILIGLLIFGYAEVRGADWVFVGDYYNFRLYYDAQSISHPSKDIVQITAKSEESEEYKKQHRHLETYEIILLQFNCKEKSFRVLSHKEYSKDGKFIKDHQWPEGWMIILPILDYMEGLYKAVCK